MNKWHICPTCSGDGAHSQALGVIKVSDWDQDELADYLEGAYDSICQTCKGWGKITTVQLEAYEPVRYYATDEEYYRKRPGGY